VQVMKNCAKYCESILIVKNYSITTLSVKKYVCDKTVLNNEKVIKCWESMI